MTVVSLTAIHTKPGASWEDIREQLKKAADLARKHGAENVTTMFGLAAGPFTGTISMVATCADWTSYGKHQDAVAADPEMRALRADRNSPVASWDTYVLQTIPDI
jgi:hypothetical protein